MTVTLFGLRSHSLRTVIVLAIVLWGTAPAAGERLLPDCFLEFDYDTELVTGEVLQEDALPRLETFVRENKAFLDHFMQFYQREIPVLLVSPPLNPAAMSLAEMVNSDVPDFNRLRLGARAVAIFADYYRLTGQGARSALISLQIFKSGVDAGYGYGTLHTQISLMISVAMQKIAMERLMALFASRALSGQDELRVIRAVSELCERRLAFREMLDAERRFATSFRFRKHYSTYFLMGAGKEEGQKQFKKILPDRFTLFFWGDRAQAHLTSMQAKAFGFSERAAGRGYPEGRELFRQAEEFSHQCYREASPRYSGSVTMPQRLAATIFSIGMPDFKRAYDQDMKIVLYARALELVHLLNGYRRHFGSYPSDLDTLAKRSGKTLPLDVYSGELMHYRSEGETFRLYSSGGDFEDNGGDEKQDLPLWIP